MIPGDRVTFEIPGLRIILEYAGIRSVIREPNVIVRVDRNRIQLGLGILPRRRGNTRISQRIGIKSTEHARVSFTHPRDPLGIDRDLMSPRTRRQGKLHRDIFSGGPLKQRRR